MNRGNMPVSFLLKEFKFSYSDTSLQIDKISERLKITFQNQTKNRYSQFLHSHYWTGATAFICMDLGWVSGGWGQALFSGAQ